MHLHVMSQSLKLKLAVRNGKRNKYVHKLFYSNILQCNDCHLYNDQTHKY